MQVPRKKMRIYQTPVSYVPPAETDTLLAHLQYRVAAVELQLPTPRSMYTMYAQVPLKLCPHIAKTFENVAMKEEIQDEPKAESPLVICIRRERVETACLCHFSGDDPISQQDLFIVFTIINIY